MKDKLFLLRLTQIILGVVMSFELYFIWINLLKAKALQMGL